MTLLKSLVRPTGIEPVAYNLGGCRSIQLSYERNPDFVVILEDHVKLGVYGFNGSKHLTSKWALLVRAAGKEFMSRMRRKGQMPVIGGLPEAYGLQLRRLSLSHQ